MAKVHGYKLAGSAIPPQLVGRILNVFVAETFEEAVSRCKDGNAARVVDLFNQQHILNQERVGKGIAESEEVTKALAADPSGDSAMKLIQDGTDAYLSGAKAAGVGGATKAKAAQIDAAKAKIAEMTPEQREKRLKMLAELGITL